MSVTLLGIVTLFRMSLYVERKALVPMRVTGTPPNAAGIITAPPEPMYFVMVIVPFSIVYSKSQPWAGALNAAKTKPSTDSAAWHLNCCGNLLAKEAVFIVEGNAFRWID